MEPEVTKRPQSPVLPEKVNLEPAYQKVVLAEAVRRNHIDRTDEEKIVSLKDKDPMQYASRLEELAKEIKIVDCMKIYVEEAHLRFNLISNEEKNNLLALSTADPKRFVIEVHNKEIPEQSKEAEALRYVAVAAMYGQVKLDNGKVFDREIFNSFNSKSLAERKELVDRNELKKVVKILSELNDAVRYEIIKQADYNSYLNLVPKDIISKFNRDLPNLESDIKQKRTEENKGIIRPTPTEQFSLLFNNSDLNNWAGNKAGWTIEDGILRCKAGEGGVLYYKKQLSEFTLKFDFKFSAKGNNGLAAFYPGVGDPAYQGIELQILDKKSHDGNDLKPWQAHGAIYGICAVDLEKVKNNLKPAGQWNSQVVIVKDRSIHIKLNGVEILNIGEVDKLKPLDGKSHPGLNLNDGFIGFIAHGDAVEFANVHISKDN